MSGGSFDYLCQKDWPEALGQTGFREMIHYLREIEAGTEWNAPVPGAGRAADEMQALQDAVDAFEPLWERLRPLLKAAEWWRSGDWGRDYFVDSLAEYETSKTVTEPPPPSE